MNKLISKYKQLTPPVKASLWFAICNILQKCISMISVPIFTRLLTTEEYGIYSVYQSWSQIITIFATLNLFNGVFNNGMVKYKNDKDGFTSAIQSLASFITIVIFIIYLIFKGEFNRLIGLPDVLMYSMFIEILITPAFSFWASRKRYDYQYKKLVIVTLALSILSPIVGIIAVILSDYKVEARIISFVVVETIICICIYIYNIYKGKKIFSKEYWIYGLSFNLPLIPHYLSQTILNQADRIMIKNMVGSAEAAIYSVAYSIAMLMIIITSAINNSLVPYTYKNIEENKCENIYKNTKMLLILVGIGCILVSFFGPEIISIFAPPEYYNAVWIIPPVAMSVYFIFLYSLFANVEFYYEKKYFIMFASIIGAVLNIILNAICIKMFGYIAAGYTTLLCYILFALAHYYFMKKILKKCNNSIKIYDSKFIVILSIIFILSSLGIIFTYQIIYIKYIITFIIGLVAFLNRKTIISSFKNIKMSKERG